MYPVDPDAWLDSLIPIGWKLGLYRMRILSEELGRPQDSFSSIHVVGTNGKTSVARMTAAIAAAHGQRAGCSVSPHVDRWSERVLIDGREIEPAPFAKAVEETASAAARVNARLEQGDELTQFEVATAAAFVALARAEVDLAVIEAGLGGRLDATNTIPSAATVLTSIGLDHTEYLGETELEIAGEKLAVLNPGTTLILGPVTPRVEELARRTAGSVGAEVIAVEAGGSFRSRNFAVAAAAARSHLGRLDPGLTARVEREIVIPGRLQRVSDDPPTYVDVAHNRPGAAALAEALPQAAGGRPVVACFAVLADKDAAGMLAELAGTVSRAVFTALPPSLLEARGRPGARSRAPVELLELAREAGLAAEAVADPGRAVARARELAAAVDGVALIAGSHFLLSAVA